MNYLFLPLVLASQLGSHHETWEFGPEYYYRMNMSMITELNQDEGKLMGSHLVADLACRPMPTDILMCRVGNSSITKITPKPVKNISEFNVVNAVPDDIPITEYRAFGIGGKQFAMKFNEKGVASILVEDVEPSFPMMTLNIFRFIANQFNIGLIPHTPHFSRLENSTVGKCNAYILVSRKSTQTKDLRLGCPVSDLMILPDGEFPRLSNDTVVEVEKIIHSADCGTQATYEFPTRYTFGFVLREVINRLRISTSRLVVTENSFLSETVYASTVFDEEKNELGKVADIVSVHLESVKPAREELHLFANSLTKEIFLEEELH